ncbi:MAG: hypothetical protein A2161_14065 [Candidatus Schekmanbacteria bacterium RBG_13_48_7]|uniref:Uncharacterized protein n=1 Tax=Candidatus Schekmanbacteria bacterium RBG_13_48_7 TaxID=1817878 RepID=A0A1F7S104_9BACT|nr:MAG: hypothetical protein A2161_14065 [Candidatus Schekmanbacteria bacterium RBG_13_48_7]
MLIQRLKKHFFVSPFTNLSGGNKKMLLKTGNGAFKLDDISEERGVAASLIAEFARRSSNMESLTYPSTFERTQENRICTTIFID